MGENKFGFINHTIDKIHGAEPYVSFVLDFSNLLDHDTLHHSIIVDFDDLSNLSKVNNIRGFILFMPFLYEQDVSKIMNRINKMEWKGKVLIFDIKSNCAQDWIRKVPTLPGMSLRGVEDIEQNFFVMRWNKFRNVKEHLKYDNAEIS